MDWRLVRPVPLRQSGELRLQAVLLAVLLVVMATRAVAATPAAKCNADKLKLAGKYAQCRAKATAKADAEADAKEAKAAAKLDAKADVKQRKAPPKP